jgi:YjbE family integral membrane protein
MVWVGRARRDLPAAQAPEGSATRVVELTIVEGLLKIVAIDLVLSGDNAVVIGMAAGRLPLEQRRKAILWGGGGAVVLRIVFTILAALLLLVPLLMALGGLLLLWIALQLILPAAPAHGTVAAATTLPDAIRTIILADVVMSLDNMVAVAGAAHGHLWLLLFGLCLSIPLLLLGSSAIARLIDRFPWINVIGAAILIHTALTMIFRDPVIHHRVAMTRLAEWAIMAVILALFLSLARWLTRRQGRRGPIPTA